MATMRSSGGPGILWRAVIAAVLLALGLAAPAEAQRRPTAPRPFVERGFITVAGGAQASTGDLSDRLLFERYAETGTIEAEYPGWVAVAFDVTAGLLVRGRVGAAVGVSQARRSGSARVAAEIPHPFFANRPRAVSGDAGSIDRIETAVHGQLYYDMRPRGAWRVRLSAGPSYVHVDQEVVTGVQAEEVYPFDTAGFGTAATGRAKGSTIGVNAGLDVARMFTRRVGVSGLVRYAFASLDLEAPDARRVPTDGGGLQAGVGLRLLF
jgi:hypothetical protein